MSRLLLAKAEVEMDTGKWANAVQNAAEAGTLARALTASEPPLGLSLRSTASILQTKALLASGHDEGATERVKEEFWDILGDAVDTENGELASRRLAARAVVHRQLGLISHAKHDIIEAGWSFLRALCALDPKNEPPFLPPEAKWQAWETERWALALGYAYFSKERWHAEVDDGLKAPYEACRPAAVSFLGPPATAENALADALMQVQVQMHHQKWELAERGADPLVGEAESISYPQHARVAIVLTLIAEIMAHTQRVTLAEGLMRQAAQLLKLDPSKPLPTDPETAGVAAVHPSVAAWVAWRFVQLLTALPKRSTERDAWKQAAQTLMEPQSTATKTSVQRQGRSWLESHFGKQGRLKGIQDPSCHGCMVDSTFRRVLPCRWSNRASDSGPRFLRPVS